MATQIIIIKKDFVREAVYIGTLFQQEPFCEKKSFVVGNIMLQETFWGTKRFVEGNFLLCKHFVRKCFVQETFC